MIIFEEGFLRLTHRARIPVHSWILIIVHVSPCTPN